MERDGPEREYGAGGALLSERFFARNVPTGLWRTWYADGTPRSEVDFGEPGSDVTRPSRFWHPNGRLAAEGPTRAAVREGAWSYWTEDGVLARTGSYRAGERDGPWTFYDAKGAKQAEGVYRRGERVGTWTLWDERGTAHARAAGEVVLPDGQ
jgi:antitoxin component YwqK of YwqJK toxin-antitoxin module